MKLSSAHLYFCRFNPRMLPPIFLALINPFSSSLSFSKTPDLLPPRISGTTSTEDSSSSRFQRILTFQMNGLERGDRQGTKGVIGPKDTLIASYETIPAALSRRAGKHPWPSRAFLISLRLHTCGAGAPTSKRRWPQTIATGILHSRLRSHAVVTRNPDASFARPTDHAKIGSP